MHEASASKVRYVQLEHNDCVDGRSTTQLLYDFGRKGLRTNPDLRRHAGTSQPRTLRESRE